MVHSLRVQYRRCSFECLIWDEFFENKIGKSPKPLFKDTLQCLQYGYFKQRMA
jgi:hypothetical protein